MRADWSTVSAPVKSFTSAGMMSPGRTRTMSPGTRSRAAITCQLALRSTPRTDPHLAPQRLDDARCPALLRSAYHGVDDKQCAHQGEIREIL